MKISKHLVTNIIRFGLVIILIIILSNYASAKKKPVYKINRTNINLNLETGIVEEELKVNDFKPTDQLIPFWMIVEKESELEVTDVVIANNWELEAYEPELKVETLISTDDIILAFMIGEKEIILSEEYK